MQNHLRAEKTAQLCAKIYWILVLFLPAGMLFLPAVHLPGGADMGYVYLTALLALGVLNLIIYPSHRLLGEARIYCLYFLFLLVWGAVSLFRAIWLWYSVYNVYYLASGVLIITAMAAMTDRKERLARLLDVLTVCFLVILAFGLFEIFTGSYVFSPDNRELLLKNELNLHFPYATFDNTNDFSTYITVFAPFAVYAIVTRLRGVFGRLAAGMVVLLSVFVLFCANARICWFATALWAAAFSVALGFKTSFCRHRRVYFTVLSAAAVLFVVLLVGSGLLQREAAGMTMEDHSVSERFSLTLAAFRMVPDSHFMGIGSGNFVPLVPHYIAGQRPINLHNMTLKILTEYGIILFVLYLVLLLSLLVRFFRHDPKNLRGGVLSSIFFASVVSFPLVGVAAADTTHLLPVWLLPGLWLAGLRVFSEANRPQQTGRRLLFDAFIDFGDMTSGSSVRPQRMAAAFRELDYDVVLLQGLQNRRRDRWRRVYRIYRQLRHEGMPDFCYVEPPSGPFFNLCDHMLLLWLKFRGVPIGLFYRDAYWKFADWWQVKGVKRAGLVLMHRFDLLIFRLCCRVVFFPTASMAELFHLPRKGVLPPAGVDLSVASHPVTHRALYVGGVSNNYGTDILLKAFEIVNEHDGRDIRLTLVCREAESAGVFEGWRGRPWLTIAHASGDEQLRPYYEGCDFAVYPSRRDFYMDFCMPVKLFEYLSRALPVVCTSCREAAAFVGRAGFGLVCEDTPGSLAQAVLALYDTPGRLEALRQAGEDALKNGNLWTHRARQAAEEILKV